MQAAGEAALLATGQASTARPQRNTMRKFESAPGKMSAFLRRIAIKKLANLASASIARAKTAVFHTFHENKVKIIGSCELKLMK